MAIISIIQQAWMYGPLKYKNTYVIAYWPYLHSKFKYMAES